MILVCLVILGHVTLWIKTPNVSHHPTKFCGFVHCGNGGIMILVCHVILEDQVIKALKSAITIFSKAHGMSYSHRRNFSIKVALTKTFACVSSESSLILATPSCITIDQICAKKLMSKCLGNLFRGLLEKTKCQIIRFFSGTSYGGTESLSRLVIHLFI